MFLFNFHRGISNYCFQIMNKKANLKLQMKVQDKIQMSAVNLELPQVKSSKELLRKMKIKREK